MKMKHLAAIVLLSTLLCACGEGEAQGPSLPPDVFYFDAGGLSSIHEFGTWRVTASRDGRFHATHAERGRETAYDEVVLEPPVRAILWAAIDTAAIDTLRVAKRPGVPDEATLTFRLEKGTGETFEAAVWANDARERLTLVPLLQELKIRIEEISGVKPVF